MKHSRSRFTPILLAAAMLALLPTPHSHAASTTRVSVSSSGEQGDYESRNGYASNNISADGRYVAFESTASNLVANDTNNSDIFVHDRQNGQTTMVSVSSDGTQGNGGYGAPSISADGRYVCFLSSATNLVADDTNGKTDIFVHDRQNGQTTRVSVNSTNDQGGWPVDLGTISPDGRYVTFSSSSSNFDNTLVDSNNAADIFIRDRQTGQTSMISKAFNVNSPGNGNSDSSAASRGGRYVVFSSNASNLVSNDTNGKKDVFVRDRQTGTTTLVSVNAAGSSSGNNWSADPAISDDGRYVAFLSGASDLITNDTNDKYDIFVRDLTTSQTTRVSLDADGNELNQYSSSPAISADGRYVGYITGDINNPSMKQGFVHDRETGKTKLGSVNNNGTQGNGPCAELAISANGRYVTFTSSADNLVTGDTNGYDDIFVRDLADFPWPMFLPAITNKK